MSASARLIRRGREADDQAKAPEAAPAPRRLVQEAVAVPAGRGLLPRRLGGGARSPGRPAPISVPAGAASLPFGLLVFFILLVYTRPQDLVPELAALRLPLLAGMGAAAAFAVDALGRGVPLLPGNRETRLMGAFLVLAAASVPLSLWPGESFSILVNVLARIALVFVLIQRVVDTSGRVRVFMTALVVAGTYLAAGSLYWLATGGANRYGGRVQGLVGGMFRDPNDLALTLVVMISLAGFLLLASRSMLSRVLFGAAIVVMLAGLLGTLSRGGLIAMAVAGALGVRRLARHGVGVAVMAVALLAAGVVFLAPEGLEQRATSIVTREGDTGSIDARLTTLKYGVEILLENPAPGVGLGAFTMAEGLKHGGAGKWNEAHNAFLQVGGELGWAGLGVYLALCTCAVLNARRAARQAEGDRTVVTLAHGIETAIVGFLAGAMFLSQGYTWHLYVLLGLAIALRDVSARTPASGPLPAVAGPLQGRGPQSPQPLQRRRPMRIE